MEFFLTKLLHLFYVILPNNNSLIEFKLDNLQDNKSILRLFITDVESEEEGRWYPKMGLKVESTGPGGPKILEKNSHSITSFALSRL